MTAGGFAAFVDVGGRNCFSRYLELVCLGLGALVCGFRSVFDVQVAVPGVCFSSSLSSRFCSSHIDLHAIAASAHGRDSLLQVVQSSANGIFLA